MKNKIQLLILIVILFGALNGFCLNTNSLINSTQINESRKKILILNSWGTGLPIPDETKQGIQIALAEGGMSMNDIFFEDLDLVRASGKEHRLNLVSLLSSKIIPNQVGIVMLLGSSAVDFIANEGKELFPHAALISLITPNVNSLSNDPRKIIHLPWRVDPFGSVNLAKQLFPDTKHVFVITGANDGVLPFLQDAKEAFIPWENTIDFEYSDNMTYEEMIQRSASLKSGSVILYSTFFSDKLNRSFIPFEVVSEVCRKSEVPVFATLEYYMGLGIVGGSLLETEKLGKQAGNIAFDYLIGNLILTEQVTTFDTPVHTMVDWKEISGFQSGKKNIPKDCLIVGKPLSFWEQFKLIVIAVVSVIFILSSLIITLLLWNRRIRKIRAAISESEARFRVMIEHAPEAVIVVDVGTDKIVDANAKAEQLFGCSRQELFRGGPGIFYHDNQPDRLSIEESKALYVSLALDGKEVVYERVIKSKDGRELICEVRLVQLPDPEKLLLRGSFIDITKRKQLETELINTKEHAIESDRLKSAFLANMSHEIRTPMNGILGFTELLKDHNLTGKEQEKYIKIIETSGERLLNIVNDIINISKIESNQMEIILSTTNINEQMDFLISFFKPEAEAKGIKLILKGSLELDDAEIITDQEKVYAILTNLIKNAVKFTSHGSVELDVKKNGEFIEFSVKDTGVGISPEEKDYIFKRFTNSPDFLNKTQRGAGLGLSISKAYVEMLGGKIWLNTEPGQGSTFHFSLPCKGRIVEDDPSVIIRSA
jgi:two-component system sensor histidine kinase/response regulator